MGKRRLTPDELGEKGEAELKLLCANAGLICNSSTRDRAGWDVVIDFPFPTGPTGVPMDRRPHPPQCWGQAKAVWKDNKYVKLRLSSAERLAKVIAPACIFVLVVDQKLILTRIVVIHVIDAILEKILKAVRECEKRGTTQINQDFINLNYDSLGQDLIVSGESLKSYVETITEAGQASYAAKKAFQIENLGFIGNRITGTFNLLADSDAELTDVLLGEKPGRIANFSTSETRFGITLPVDNYEDVMEVMISPQPIPALLKFIQKDTDESVEMEVGFVRPAFPTGFSTSSTKIKMLAPGITIYMQRSTRELSANFQFDFEKPLSLREYSKILAIQTIVSGEGGGTMTMKIKKKPLLRLDFIPPTSADLYANLTYISLVIARIKRIIDSAGGSKEKFRLKASEINSQIRAITLLDLLMRRPGEINLREITLPENKEFSNETYNFEMLVVGRLHFSDGDVAFCAIGVSKMFLGAESKQILKIESLRLREMEVIESDQGEYDSFLKKMQNETGVTASLIWQNLASQDTEPFMN